MNPRYRMLTIREEKYIMDMGGWSFWKMLFPFFYWILPNTAYQVKDHDLIKKITVPEAPPQKTGMNGLLAGGLGVVLANLLQPLVNLFDVEGTTFVNAIIVGAVFIITLSVFFYININSNKKLAHTIDLHQYKKHRLWIRPQSPKHIFHIIITYLSFTILTIFALGGFILIAANVVILLIGMMFLSFLLLFSILTVRDGNTTVRFKKDSNKNRVIGK